MPFSVAHKKFSYRAVCVHVSVHSHGSVPYMSGSNPFPVSAVTASAQVCWSSSQSQWKRVAK